MLKSSHQHGTYAYKQSIYIHTKSLQGYIQRDIENVHVNPVRQGEDRCTCSQHNVTYKYKHHHGTCIHGHSKVTYCISTNTVTVHAYAVTKGNVQEHTVTVHAYTVRVHVHTVTVR